MQETYQNPQSSYETSIVHWSSRVMNWNSGWLQAPFAGTGADHPELVRWGGTKSRAPKPDWAGGGSGPASSSHRHDPDQRQRGLNAWNRLNVATRQVPGAW